MRGPGMSIEMFVWLLGLATVAAILIGLLVNKSKLSRKLTRVPPMDMRQQVLENKYFRSIARGDFARPLARVYSQMDMALIESIFSSRNIAFQSLFGLTNNLRTGLGIRGYNDMLLVVLNSEYHRAKETMLEYLDKRRLVCNVVPGKTRLRNAIETLLFGWAANSSYRLPELLPLRDAKGGKPVRPINAGRGRRRKLRLDGISRWRAKGT
jgi:hypothetical protein